MELNTLSLIDIFRNEAESQGLLFEKALLSLLESPQDATHLESAMRAAHSLKGASQIIGAKGISHIAHHLEECFVIAQTSGIPLKRADLNCLLEVFESLVRIRILPEGEILNWPGLKIEEAKAMHQSLVAITADLQQKRGHPRSDYDERFLNLFQQDFQTHVKALAVLAYETQAIPSFNDNLIRIPHSIKGAAGIVGFGNLSKLCEGIESWFLGLKEGVWPWDESAKAFLKEIVYVFDILAAAPLAELGKEVLKIDSRISQLIQELVDICSYSRFEGKTYNQLEGKTYKRLEDKTYNQLEGKTYLRTEDKTYNQLEGKIYNPFEDKKKSQKTNT